MLQNQHPSVMSIETDHNKVFIKNKLKSLMCAEYSSFRQAALRQISGKIRASMMQRLKIDDAKHVV
jgi:hypothetical protein